LSNLKRLATVSDTIMDIENPFSLTDIGERNKDYPVLSDKKFATKHSKSLFLPVKFRLNNAEHTIQYNFCINPFCKWFGQPQTRFSSVKNKPYRYKLIGKEGHKSIQCNCDPIYPNRGMALNCTTTPYSNWSMVQEIERLLRIGTVRDIEPEYEFHKETCRYTHENPFDDPSLFYKRGKSKTGTQRWQCKTCGKRTDMLPTRRQTSTYHQKRNDILPLFTKLLVNKMPVSRTVDVLGIGVKTYYSKLEWVYRRCLEFLERHEQKPLDKKSFGTVWINTDKMIYYLNNVRKKGMGGGQYDDIEDKRFPTHIIVSADVFSRYVFRSDVAYDWDIRLEDIMLDTVLCKEDHLHEFARKHARLRYSSYPQEPTENDTQTQAEYNEALRRFNLRERYIEGLHTNSTYTTMAHFWLIKELLKAKEWRFITDNDTSLMSAMYRVFVEDFKSYSAHHFLCLTDREKTRKEAYNEFQEAKQDLFSWGLSMGIDSRSPYTIAYHYLEDLFKVKGHAFHKEITLPTHKFLVKDNNPIIHPLASIDKGYSKVDCTTDLSSLEPEQVAKMLLNVNDHATNFFIQQIRRKLSVLERPLTTARGDGKSYIYSNFNPKYAQMVLTILRTYYNFCMPYKSADKKKLTPAQRLGITTKQFKIEDILYLR
jgi:transposase-like protein